jgi:3-phenylpropionate/cinnamic acid dioxygenase small subunit
MTTLQLLLDRAAIEDVVARLAHTQDDKDFAGFRALFDERVRLTMSAGGGPPQDLSGDELAAVDRSTLAGFTSTQHLTSNVLTSVDGDTARCRVSVQAYHHVPTEPGVADYCLQRNRWELELRRTDRGWLITAWSLVANGPAEGYLGLYRVAAEAVAGT